MSQAPTRTRPSRSRAKRIRPAALRLVDGASVPLVRPDTVEGAIPSFGEIGLDQFAPYLLNRFSAQWNARLGDLLRDLGLSTTMFRALAVLTLSSGATVNELALFALTEQSTMSRTLDALEDGDLIRRRAKADDMRVREVFITGKGLMLFEGIWPDIYKLYAGFFAGVDETEFRGFLATLSKIMRNTMASES